MSRNVPAFMTAVGALVAIAGSAVTAAGPPMGGRPSARQAVRTEARRAAAMRDHFNDVTLVQEALIRGDLVAMRRSARAIADRPGPAGLPDAATAHVLTMKAAAGEVAASNSVTTAALATASMIATCGTCHRAVGTMPALPVPARPAVGGAVGHMLEHQRALDQMLQGLVIPSTESWQQGARALATAPLHVSDLPRDPKLTPALTRVEQDVHRLAEDAIAAAGTDARSRIYGTLMGKCAECHGLHRRIWGPGKK